MPRTSLWSAVEASGYPVMISRRLYVPWQFDGDGCLKCVRQIVDADIRARRRSLTYGKREGTRRSNH